MKTCSNCKTPNADNAKFCSVCRAPFGAFGTATCPNGHTVDPTWTECPYCKGQAMPARRQTVIETPAAAAAAPPPPPPVVGGQPQRRQTVFAPPQGEAPSEPARVAPRKIVGVLITYTWRLDGQMFPVREGRNLIGRGGECDIQISEDPTLSTVNSHITFRKSFTLGDMVSMSGTDLNGVPIEEQFVALENGAKIRTGSTHWTFLAFPTVGES